MSDDYWWRQRVDDAEYEAMTSSNEHRRDGYDDGAAGVVEWSAREHARSLLTATPAPRGPAVAAAYITGYLMGVDSRAGTDGTRRWLG